MKELRDFFMEDWLEQNRFSAKYNLGESGGRAKSISEILLQSGLAKSAAQKEFLDIVLHDSPNWGRTDLRECVSLFHSHSTLSNVLITTGTSEALFLLFHVLKPRTMALAVPAFQLLYEIPEALDTKIIHLPIYWDHLGCPYVDKLEWIQILQSTKPECLLINNPHNPSGLVFENEFLEELKVLVRSWGATVIGDEHYRFLASNTDAVGYTLYDGKPNTFVTGSFIKCVGTPGLRIGWCVGDEKVLSLMQNEKNYTTHTVSPIIEWIAYEVLKNLNSDLFVNIKKEWMANKKILQNCLSQSSSLIGISPEGGLVTSIGFKHIETMHKTMQCIEILKKNGIFVLPLSSMEVGSYAFQKDLIQNKDSFSGINHGFGFRLGLGIDSSELSESVSVLAKVCDAFSSM